MKLKLVICSVIFGIILFFVMSIIAALIFELGGSNLTTGKNNLPVGFPIPCCEVIGCPAEYVPEFNEYLHKPGCSDLKFLPIPFILDLMIWIAILYFILFFIKNYKKEAKTRKS